MTDATFAGLEERITKFLSTRSESSPGGGWAPVAPNDIEAMREIMIMLLELKYERDADQDLPINVFFLDRTRYENSHLQYYRHMPDGQDGYEQALLSNIRTANRAIQSASNRLEIMMHMLEDLKREEN